MDLELNTKLESQEIRLERGSLLWSNDIKCIVNGHSVMCKSVVKMLFNAADLSHHNHLDLRLIAAKKILLWSYFHDTFFICCGKSNFLYKVVAERHKLFKESFSNLSKFFCLHSICIYTN